MLAEDPRLPKKASQSPQNDVGHKVKFLKRETKDFRTGKCTQGRDSWRRKSFHTLRSLSQAQSGENFRTSEGNIATGAWKEKQRKFTTRSLLNSTSQPRISLHAYHCEWILGAQAQALEVKPQGEDGLTAMKILRGGQYNATEGVHRKAWACHRGKRSLLWEHSNFKHSQNAGPCLPECCSWHKLTAACDSRGRKAGENAKGKTGCNCSLGYITTWLLPGLVWVSEVEDRRLLWSQC